MPEGNDNLDAKKAKKKVIAYRRAERRLVNRLKDIDWEFDVLMPELEEFDRNLTSGVIPEFTLVEDNDKAK